MTKILRSSILMLLMIVLLSACVPKGAQLEGIEIAPTSMTLFVWEKQPFQIVGTYSDGSTQDLTLTDDITVEASDVLEVDRGFIKLNGEAKGGQEFAVTFKIGEFSASLAVSSRSNPLLDYYLKDGINYAIDDERIDIIINKQISLTEDYVPSDLVIPEVLFPASYTTPVEKMYLRSEAAEAIATMFNAALEEELELMAISGYRSYALQDRIFKYNVTRFGSEEEANRISARPGESEHQTGLAMDISSKEIGAKLVEEFAETPEGQWVSEHCYDYGFIIRYQPGMEEITGYSYEPWHLRYVGVELAQRLKESGLTMEEYFRFVQ